MAIYRYGGLLLRGPDGGLATNAACCCTFVECDSCNPGTTPGDEVIATIGGIGNVLIGGNCTDCAGLNGAYPLTRIGNCEWAFHGTVPLTCFGTTDPATIDIDMQIGATNVGVTFSVTYGLIGILIFEIAFTLIISPPIDCYPDLNTNIPLVSCNDPFSLFYCDCTSATCDLAV